MCVLFTYIIHTFGKILLISALYDGGDHLKPPVWLYKIGGMCRDNDPMTSFHQVRHLINDDHGLSFDDLGKRIERRCLFC